jgi:hypothetical protein
MWKRLRHNTLPPPLARGGGEIRRALCRQYFPAGAIICVRDPSLAGLHDGPGSIHYIAGGHVDIFPRNGSSIVGCEERERWCETDLLMVANRGTRLSTKVYTTSAGSPLQFFLTGDSSKIDNSFHLNCMDEGPCLKLIVRSVPVASRK